MAKVFIEESSLTAIGDAIREKTGTTDLLSPAEMVTAIGDITTGGGADLPEEAYTITGDCSYRFAYNGWNWFLENYGSKVTTKDITSCYYMFSQSSNLKKIPFAINAKSNITALDCTNMFSSSGLTVTESNLANIQGRIGTATKMFYSYGGTSVPALTFDNSTNHSFESLFMYCYGLKEIGTLTNMYPSSLANMFDNCKSLKEIPSFENLNLSYFSTNKYASMANMFRNCYALRSIPESLLKQLKTPVAASYYYMPTYNAFDSCYALDEIRGVSSTSGAISSGNVFSSALRYCFRLKDFVFDTQEDGTPYTAQWKNQVLEFQAYTGWVAPTTSVKTDLLKYNPELTGKEVTDDATYQALKDDPDWYTTDVAYSRYNHDSAVNTINSLPDTSAYGVNTIKFKGSAGSATDGGAINTLTEEEIAVATAKGWTVTFAA